LLIIPLDFGIWAHQNFLGKDDAYNVMPNETRMERIEGELSLMRIGHALAGHQPDIPGLIWNDGRLLEQEIDNTSRFMDAADHLYRKLAAYKKPGISPAELNDMAAVLVGDLRADIGLSSKTSRRQDPARVSRYKQRALRPTYGGVAIPEYQEGNRQDGKAKVLPSMGRCVQP
jgi:hypothetical protein